MANAQVEDRDAELLRAVREAPAGDLRPFERLMEQYKNCILANCRYLTRDDNNFEDLAKFS